MSESGKHKRPTLRDVARQADVSVATVSRVLNGSEQVTGPTLARVTAAIEDLGYVPNATARNLNSGRTRTIGALVPTLDHAIFARYLDALEHHVSDHGYALVVAVTGGIADVEERKASGLLNMGAEGLIVSGNRRSGGFDRLVNRFKVPTLITSFYDPAARYPTIGYDNRVIAQKAIGYLRDLGHTSIAVIHGPTDVNDRIAARLAAIAAMGSGLDVTFVPVSMDMAGGVEAVRRISARSARPTALLCLSDVQALGALFELQRQGIAVPGDMSLMGFDDLEWSAVSVPGITSIKLPAAAMGEAAAEAIVTWLATGEPAAPRSLAADIVARGSTRALVRP